MELASYLLELQPLQPGKINPQQGYLAHAAFLQWIQQSDPGLSETLHSRQGRKPFTTGWLTDSGGPLSPPARELNIHLSKPYFFRLASLTPDLCAAIGKRQLEPGKIQIGPVGFEVKGIRVDNSARTYSALSRLEARAKWSFEFLTPTAFNLGQQEWGDRKFSLFPEPVLVFESLLSRWQEFVPQKELSLDKEAVRDYLNRFVIISSHNIQTAAWPLKGHSQLGFTGRAGFVTLEPHPSPTLTANLTSLAAFSEYCGVGYKTTMGMGSARPLAQ